MKERNELAGIDIFKLIFAFFVMFIHCHPGDDISYLLANGVGRLAVPFYFAAAGYLLARRLETARSAGKNTRTVFLKYLRRILRLYLVWTVIYLPFSFSTLIFGKGIPFPRVLVEYLRGFFFTGSFTHLWYLPALMTGAVLSFFLCRYIKPFWTFLLGTCFYLVGIFNEAYAGLCPDFLKKFFNLYNPIFERTRIGLFFGFCFVAMGFLLAERERYRKKERTALYLIGAALFTVLTCVESFYLYKNGISYVNGEARFGMYIFLLPATWFLLSFASVVKLKMSGEQAKELRKLSTFIYFSHQFVNGFLFFFITDWVFDLSVANSLIGFVIMLVLTLVFSFWAIKMEKKGGKIGKWLEKLH